VGEDYFDWRETGGIRLPRRAVMYRGERRYAEITIDDVGVNEGMTQERLSRKP